MTSSARTPSASDFASVLDGVNDPVVLFDARNRCTFANRAAAALSGREPAALTGALLGGPAFGPTPTALREAIETLRRTGAPQQVSYRSNELRRDVTATVTPMRGGYAVTAHALREVADPPIAWRLTDEQLRFIAAETSDILLLIGPGGDISYVSPSVQRVLGYAPDRLVGFPVGDFVHPHDHGRIWQNYQQVIAKPGARGEVEFRVRDALGEWRSIVATGINNIGRAPVDAFIAVWRDVTAQRVADAANATATERLRELVRRLDQVRADEQARAARDIHDRLGQTLTMARITTNRLAHDPAALPVRATLEELRAEIDTAITTAREISADLRPPLLEELGLAAALEAYAPRVAARAGVELAITLDEVALPLDDAHALFLVASEALTNVVRHAQARHVTIRLALGADTVSLHVQDDGLGFDATRLSDPLALGLLGMQERMSARGGALAVHPARPTGTIVHASLPLRAGLAS